MTYAYDASLISRIQPRIKQWEATTGRRIAPTVLDSLIKEQMEAEVGKAQQSRALDLQEQQFQNQKEQQDKASKAATVKGAFDMATTAGMLGLTYKSVTKPSEMSELLAYQKAKDAKVALDATKGAQTALGGNAPAVGAQTIPAVAPATGGSAVGISAPELAYAGTEGFVEPAASAVSTGSLVSGASTAAGLYAGQYMLGKETQPWMSSHGMKYTNMGWTYGGVPGAATGFVVDTAKKGFEVVKDFGKSIGNVLGW